MKLGSVNNDIRRSQQRHVPRELLIHRRGRRADIFAVPARGSKEVIQVASIHDVMFNTLGGLVGAMVGVLVGRIVRRSRFSTDASSLELRPETS